MGQLSFDDFEIWMPVPGYEGLYEVSSYGRVKSLRRLSLSGKRIRERLLKTQRTAGYPSVSMHRDGMQTRLYIHRLVAAAFLGPCPDDQEVRHLDGNPDNCHVSNFAYGTHAENMNDMVRHGRSHGLKPACPYGHPYTPENTIIPKGRKGRACRICANGPAAGVPLGEEECRMTLRGCDVSSFNGSPAGGWPSEAGSITWAGIKLTEVSMTPGGVSVYVNPDAVADAQYLAGEKLGRIFYAFAHPAAPVASTVTAFASELASVGFGDDDGVMLDLEQTDGLSPSAVSSWAQDVMAEFRSRLDRRLFIRTCHSRGPGTAPVSAAIRCGSRTRPARQAIPASRRRGPRSRSTSTPRAGRSTGTSPPTRR